MLETFMVSMEFLGLKSCNGVTTRGIQKCVSPSGVQFENNEWRLCVSGGVVLFVSLTISVVKLHNCVRNSIIQHRVCASVWVKNKRKIILSGQDFLTKYAKEKENEGCFVTYVRHVYILYRFPSWNKFHGLQLLKGGKNYP